MSNTVISVRGLGKSYMIGHNTASTGTFRDRIIDNVAGIRRNVGRTLRGQQLLAGDDIEEFWALRGVDFDIKHGEAVGIIGRNGAGKSTLLKILSRITEPTTGRVEIRGRVASLLEVGTGFHPELTGRENVFLNGAILGMSRLEIRRRFDEIIDFAGVDKFLDTPVKRYSSGMYVRLAFAVAAHLEPEILVVDEVLAVGDAEFQKKCLGKMKDVAGEGRTVLFVSHNITAVQRLCSKGIMLKHGEVTAEGEINAVLESYSSDGEGRTRIDVDPNVPIPGYVERVELRIFDSEHPDSRPTLGKPATLCIDVECARTIESGNISILIKTKLGDTLARLSTAECFEAIRFRKGSNKIRVDLEMLPFFPGAYNVYVAISRPPSFEHFFRAEFQSWLTVDEADIFRTGRLPTDGVLVVPHRWSLSEISHA